MISGVTLISNTIKILKHFAQYCVDSFCATKIALTPRDMTSQVLWKCAVVSGTLAANPNKCRKLQGGASMDQNCMSRTFHRCSIWEKFEARSTAFNFELAKPAKLSAMH